MSKLTRNEYEKLSQADKEQLLTDLGQRYQMTLKEFQLFDRYGQSLYTAVYEQNGSQFVFVPGDTVTLGWNSKEQILAKNLVEVLCWDLSDGEYDDDDEDEEYDEDDENDDEKAPDCDIAAFLDSVMTPIREAAIPPMLVERQLQKIGWAEIPLESEIMADYQKELEEFKQNNYNESTHVDRLKLCRTESGIKAYRYEKVSYQDLRDGLTNQGYSLPSYDEWEYLCGGGSRTLFPWGNDWDETMRTPYGYYTEEDEEMLTSDITDANFFGLYIGNDPYRYEFTLPGPSGEITKGGDGGVMLCGGSSLILGFLACAPAFRQYNFEEEPWEEDNISGDYSFYRRVIRVTE